MLMVQAASDAQPSPSPGTNPFTDWIHQSFSSDAHVDAGDITIRMCAALAFGLLIALIYRLTRGPQAAKSPLVATLVLLTVLLAMTTIVIGDNLARAFSVVGALSIVRFRTIVSDTRDTAFVIFSVGVGLAVGAGFLVVPLIAMPFAFVAAYLFHHMLDAGSVSTAHGTTCLLTVRIELGRRVDDEIAALLSRHAVRSALKGIGTAKLGDAFEQKLDVSVANEDQMRALSEGLLAIDGVKFVGLERASSIGT